MDVRWGDWLVAVLFSLAGVICCWLSVLQGAGLVGGDTYPYFLPQKQFMSEEFAAGRIPLWHDRTALGYPLLAESQGGIFYPAALLLFPLDAHQAYHLSFLLHYWLAGVFAWRFARSEGLQNVAALFASLVFVYSWFPARASLEWSIIGGVWFPFCLWQTQRLLQRPSLIRFTGCVAGFALHLLAGHFALAFITQLTCLLLAARAVVSGSGSGTRRSVAGLVPLAIICAFLTTAIQVLPTLELQRISQRDGTFSVFNVGYGHMPPFYLTQTIAGWSYWHSPELLATAAVQRLTALVDTPTNAVEAHFYPGLIPLTLCLMLCRLRIRYRLRNRAWKFWLLVGALGLVYATGCLLPLTGRLPGFAWFMGPGRYTMASTMAVAVLSGMVIDQFAHRRSLLVQLIMLVLLSVPAFIDTRWSTAVVSDAKPVRNPPWEGLQDSWIAERLAAESEQGEVRLFAPGPNIGNLFGVSSVPQYLGIGPSAYFSTEFALEGAVADSVEPFPSSEQMTKLQQLSVTHILTEEQLLNPSPGIELVHEAPDAFLNRVWGRGDRPCWLYRLSDTRPRIRAEPADALVSLTYERRPNLLQAEIELSKSARLIWAELDYPGWTVEVSTAGAAVESSYRDSNPEADDMLPLREVELSAGRQLVRWEYRPRSFLLGWQISGVMVVLLGVGCAVELRRAGRESIVTVQPGTGGRSGEPGSATDHPFSRQQYGE